MIRNCSGYSASANLCACRGVRGLSQPPLCGSISSGQLQRVHRNGKFNRIYYSSALELCPHAVKPGTGEDYVELHNLAAVSKKRVQVDEVDKIGASQQHVTPCSQ